MRKFIIFNIVLLSLLSREVLSQKFEINYLENLSELDLNIDKSNLIVFGEDNHESPNAKRITLDLLFKLNKQLHFQNLLLEYGPSFEYLLNNGDSIIITSLLGSSGYKISKKINDYNKINPQYPITIKGYDLENHFPFAGKVMKYILDKYETKEFSSLASEINNILSLNEKEQKAKLISLLDRIKSTTSALSARTEEEKLDFNYLLEIATNLEYGLDFNYKDWAFREKKIEEKINSFEITEHNKSILLIGTQHLERTIKGTTPSVYSSITKSEDKLNTHKPPLIIIDKDTNLDERLRLYLPKKLANNIVSTIDKNAQFISIIIKEENDEKAFLIVNGTYEL